MYDLMTSQTLALGEPLSACNSTSFKKAERPLGPFAGQATEIRQSLTGRDHRCHGRRVGGNNPVFFQPALQPQTRDPNAW